MTSPWNDSHLGCAISCWFASNELVIELLFMSTLSAVAMALNQRRNARVHNICNCDKISIPNLSWSIVTFVIERLFRSCLFVVACNQLNDEKLKIELTSMYRERSQEWNKIATKMMVPHERLQNNGNSSPASHVNMKKKMSFVVNEYSLQMRLKYFFYRLVKISCWTNSINSQRPVCDNSQHSFNTDSCVDA